MRRLRSIGPVGDALELAAGTGIWTRELLKIADHVTAIDASPEVLRINHRKLGGPSRVTYKQEDVFSWNPKKQFDLVSFTFWLSHVPPERAPEFLSKVYRATKPDGSVWMVDSRRASTGTAADQSVLNDTMYQQRMLNDGRTFEIVKVYYDVPRLEQLLSRAGFVADVRETESYFLHVLARKPPNE
jgi:demethylmenaquinone methyltransferase/2-methoxy-6-polyprenyl-1,4-benzoquinol methylase